MPKERKWPGSTSQVFNSVLRDLQAFLLNSVLAPSTPEPGSER